MKTRFFVAACAALSLTAAVASAGHPAPKREFRGAWIHTVGNQKYRTLTSEQIKADLIAYLDAFKQLNINAVVFQVRPQADAFYKSDLEPWSRFITGTQGQAPDDPDFDPLAFMVEEAHKRGMELHAWFNPYRVTSNDKEELCPGHLYYKKPELFVKYGKQIYFDPGRPEARAHTVRVIADVVRRYDIDAVHFDDYFYPYKIQYEEFPDEESFLMYHERDGFGRYEKNDWRRNNVNRLIRELNDTIKSIKPWVRFGISPFGVWRNRSTDPRGSESQALQTNYDDLYADIVLWTEKGWIDYNVPQLYWQIGHPKADYAPLIEWWSRNNHGAHLYIGQSAGSQLRVKQKDGGVENQLYRKMALVRENPNIQGNMWWSGMGLVRDSALVDSLKADYQRYPALIPLYAHMDTVPPSPVSQVKAKGRVLTWKAAPAAGELDRAAYFGVYRFAPGEKIDTGDATKMLTVTGGTDYALPPSDGRTYRYVVTAIDRMQNESLPSRPVSVR